MSLTPRAVPAAMLLAILPAVVWSVTGGQAAEPLALTCSADTPTVPLGGNVTLKAWARSPSGRALRYTWGATAGRIEGRGAEARWTSECLMRVTVRRDAGGRGFSRETGQSFLPPGQSEAAGYGLYSYLLLGAPPSESSRDRYLKAIDAYLTLVPDVADLEQYVPRRELNIFYMPVRSVPPPPVTAQWVLDNYDYARARSLLRALPGPNRDGPYILAAFKPPGGANGSAGGQYLFQDLSSVPPHLAASWVREFLNQAAQERFWEEKTAVQVAQRLRVTVGIMGAGLPEVRKSLDSWITWVK